MARKSIKYIPLNDLPLLQKIDIRLDAHVDKTAHPFCIPIIQNTTSITFTKPVTFLIGQNGAGKSTILEAIAYKIGFGPEGGSKNIHFTTTTPTAAALGECMKLTWSYKPLDGYFFRAESFFNVANYLDGIGGNQPYVNKSLHHQSHGESFFSFFSNRLGDQGIYILDEPEAALSPERQIALLRIIYDLTRHNTAQFIIATHSPILLAYPNATIYSCDQDHLHAVPYKDTQHYQVTKRFLDNPELYLKNLFSDE
jgi:predicted ATPase